MANRNCTTAMFAVQDLSVNGQNRRTVADLSLAEGFWRAVLRSRKIHKLRVVRHICGYSDDPETLEGIAHPLSSDDATHWSIKAASVTHNSIDPGLVDPAAEQNEARP